MAVKLDQQAALRKRGTKQTAADTRAADTKAAAKGHRKPKMPYLQAQVVHYKPRVSVLDKELTTVSYHGLVNFCLLLLSATLIRLAIENYMKYGILVSIPGTGVSRRDWVAMLVGIACVGVSFFVALAIEVNAIPKKPASEGKGEALRVGVSKEEKVTVAMHLANLAFVLVVPSCITYFAIFQPALGTLVMMLACIMFLKLYSLAATNFDLRRAYRLGDKGLDSDPLRIDYSVAYPRNVTLRNFGYFWLAPTLCYQPSYPRIAGPIRKSFVAKRLTELVILCITMYIVIQQYAIPTLVGSVQAIDKRDGFWLSERVLKLSVISAAIWFLGFYAIFHAGLNALAEVLRFADRAFYLDWWNSVDLAAYWREWNLPIHYFCKRHIMMPLISAPLSLPVDVGVVFTFLVSAIMHELLFGIPTHSLKGYSFVGMMAQIPLIQVTQWLVRWRGPESGLGNAVFWISFCIVGQPLGVVQYYYTWVKNNP
ncbi:hypothetical protein GQ54DRAFT_315343 [Martensiomyces pterosporus]|nr:hypothetical protein GQ54DRAFT_315343 [Martensiomyces pterosporus]